MGQRLLKLIGVCEELNRVAKGDLWEFTRSIESKVNVSLIYPPFFKFACLRCDLEWNLGWKQGVYLELYLGLHLKYG